MRCIAIDDEKLGLELLTDSIQKVPYLQLAGSYTDPFEAHAFLQQEQVDLVFLDIQMPGMSGLQFIKGLHKPPLFILVTAYEKYALEGYSLNVVDYLMKPVALERFVQACGKAFELHHWKRGSEDKREPSYFFINADYTLLKVVFADIMYIEGLKDYIKIHLHSTSKPILSRTSLKNLEEQLPLSRFIRIHKSYIVSKEYVTALKKNCIYLNTLELPVGESYKDVVEQIAHSGY